MDGSSLSPKAPVEQFSLQTLVAVLAQGVQAQNLIASKLASLITTLASTFPAPLSSSATWDPPNLANNASETTTVTVAGAALGNYVQVSFSLDLQGMTLTGYVSSTNTVTVVLSNATGGAINLASGTLKVRVTTV